MIETAVVIGVVALVVTGVVGAVLLGAARSAKRSGPRTTPVATGHWRAAHYDVEGITRVVVQKVSATGVNKLDEHVVAELRRDDPDYEGRFLEAMSAARQRQSLFEAEGA